MDNPYIKIQFRLFLILNLDLMEDGAGAKGGGPDGKLEVGAEAKEGGLVWFQ